MNKIHSYLLITTALLASACGKQAPEPTANEPTDEHAEAATMPAAMAERAGVKLATAAPGKLRETLTLYGSIQADPDRVRKIGARYAGIVRSVHRDIGDRVAVGEKLATVESNESLQIYSVTSPLAGIVTARHTNSGEVAGEAPLFEVADYSQVRVDLSVFPRDRVRLKSGQTVHVIAADGASTADGKIAYIAPAGTAQVIVARVALSNKDGRWTAGQFVTGEVVVDETQAGIVVLPSALQQMKGQTVVFVQHGDNIEARTIDIGKRTSDAIEVKSGLEVGEQYVVDNSYLVKAELMKSEAEEE